MQFSFAVSYYFFAQTKYSYLPTFLFHFNKEQRVNIDTALFKYYSNEIKNLNGFEKPSKLSSKKTFSAS